MIKSEIELLAREVMERYDLFKHGFKFGWRKLKRDYGVCCPNDKAIYLSETLTPELSDEKIYDLICHEVAHGICLIRYGGNWPYKYKIVNGRRKRYYQKHGKEWKDICKEMGYNPYALEY